ncbi:MAG: response regulator transcription factor [Ignavibacteriaceae bacterium]|nr:response regulator transcription factor [Ignavibacteriaceae bacterium]
MKILIIDDHRLFREGVKRILSESISGITFFEAGSIEEIYSFSKSKFDLIILDLNLPGRSGLSGISELKSVFPEVNILVLSFYSANEMAVNTIKAGASGFISKDEAPEKLLQAVESIISTGRYVSDELLHLLSDEMFGNLKSKPHKRLSPRETEIFLLIAQGFTVTEIASKLNLSVKTVSTHKRSIFDKTGLKNNAEIFNYVITEKLL